MKTISILLFFFTSLPALAQLPNFKETWRQKKTQKEYLAKQIALLQTYLEFLKQGYKVVSKGLYTIENIKNGDFNLHRDFLSSFKNVNPAIANSARVADVAAFQIAILKELKHVNSFVRRSSNFTPQEVRYISEVYTNMIKLCDASVSELLLIARSGKAEMKDNERIDHINKLYKDMSDKYAFTRRFSNDVQLLSAQRQREAIEMTNMKTTFNL